jgi:nicotinamide phosphoribosyltransferase
MGGALLQGVNRDTLGFAMKASAIENADGWYDVYKDPVNASSKRSTPGRMAVVVRDGVYKNIRLEELKAEEKNHLELVYRNGFMYRKQTLAGVRANTDKF